MENNILKDVTISQLDENYNLKRMIVAKAVNINENNWILYKVLLFKENSPLEKYDTLEYFSILILIK